MISDPRLFLRIFRLSARRHWNATALVDKHRSWTYGELYRHADAWSRRLHDVPGDRIALMCDRSFELVAAMLGIWTSGRSYSHLDPSYPPEYHRLILSDAGITHVISDDRNALSASQLSVTVLPSAVPVLPDAPEGTLLQETADDDEAYVIFTSGSTGTPKGVMISQGALGAFCGIAAKTLGVEQDDCQLFSAPPTYALGVRQLYAPLSIGARVFIADPADMAEPSRFLALLHDHPITLIDMVPSYWRELVEWSESVPAELRALHRPRSLRQIVSVGEPLRTDIPERWRRIFGKGIRLVNIYGQTETTGIVCRYVIPDPNPDGHSIAPVGSPASDTTIHLLNGRMEPVQDGEEGEFFIDSPSLALGYLNAPELTAERFPANPFAEQRSPRLYRTGDIGMRMPDGTLRHLGRRDQQVKIRGMRLELGEVEQGIGTIPGVRTSHVLLVEGRNGTAALAAFVVPDGSAAHITRRLVRAELRKRLPHQMIPSEVVLVDALPVTNHNKVDRKALLELRAAAQERSAGSMLYAGQWEPLPSPSGSSSTRVERWCILDDRGGSMEAAAVLLRAQGMEVLHVSGHRLGQHLTSGVTPAAELLDQWNGEATADPSRRFGVLFAAAAPLTGEGAIPASPDWQRYDALLELAAQLRRSAICPDALVVMTAGSEAVLPEERTIPAQTVLTGLGRTAALELSGCRFLSVDLGTGPFDAGAVASILSRPWNAEEDTVACRRRRWYRRIVRPVSIPEHSVSRFREGGTYLITGGLGDIPLTVCEHLSARFRARYILLSRTGLDGLGRDGVDGEAQRQRLASIEQLGSRIDVIQADVTDREDLERALAPFGKDGITGVLHAAGERGRFMPVDELANEPHSNVLTVKSEGTIHLLRALEQCRPEFVMMFSSVSSLLGRVGYAEYCAANAFLDGVADAGWTPIPVISVNWDSWNGIGLRRSMAKEFGDHAHHDDGDALSASEGAAVFDLLADAPTGRYIVSKEPWSERTASVLRDRPASRTEPAVSGGTDLRRSIRSIWALAVHHENFSDDDSFFDVGGDSLSALLICLEAEKVHHRTIPLSRFFLDPTVKTMVALVSGSSADDPVIRYSVIHPDGSRPPLLLWGVNQAMPLLRFFGPDQPVIIFPVQAAQSDDGPPLSLEHRVAEDLRSAERFLAGRRCVTGGFSLGGIYAYEAAWQLRSAGMDVPEVLMIDASAFFVPSYTASLPDDVLARLNRERYRRLLQFHSRSLFRLPFHRMPHYLFDAVRDVVHRRRRRRSNAGNERVRVSVLSQYRLPALPCDVRLFTTTERFEYKFMEHDYGWGRVAGGRVIVDEIGGSHVTQRSVSPLIVHEKGIMDYPHVTRLASAVNTALEGMFHA